MVTRVRDRILCPLESRSPVSNIQSSLKGQPSIIRHLLCYLREMTEDVLKQIVVDQYKMFPKSVAGDGMYFANFAHVVGVASD